MRLGPWAFLFFVCYEQYKRLGIELTAPRLEEPKKKGK